MSDKITSNEKLEFLYYKSQNLAITDLDANLQKDIFLENKNYIFSESVLAESIPSITDITVDASSSTFKLSQNDLFNNPGSISLKKDSNNIVLKVTQLKLQNIPNSDTGWYYLDASKNNFLTPLIPPNYKSTDNGSNAPYQVKIYSEKGLERVKNNTAILTNELLRSCDYIFDYENGILLLAKDCKDVNGELISTENPPYISFYKYIGARGKANTLDGQWLKDNSDIYYDSGAVIIGNNTKISSDQNKYNLEISGNVYISNNLCVKGKQIIRDDLHIIDTMDISGNLTVEGKSFFKDDVSGNEATFNKITIDGDFIVDGKTTIKDISGADASFNNIDIDGYLTVDGKSIFQDVSGNDASFNNIDVCGNKLNAKNIYITGNLYQNGNIFSTTNAVNEIGQSFFEIITQQPSQFEQVGDISKNSTEIKLSWGYDNILATLPNKNLAKLSFQSATNLQNLPHISQIHVDISGVIDSSPSLSKTWIDYHTFTMGNSADYTSQVYKNITIHKTSDADKNNSNKLNILSKQNPFDIRIYGINNAVDYPSIDDRALVFKNLAFTEGKVPAKPIFVRENSISSDDQLSYVYKVEETENGNSLSNAVIVSAISDASQNTTLSSSIYPFDPSVFRTVKSLSNIKKDTNFDLSLTNLRAGTKYNYKVQVKNNIKDGYSEFSNQQVSEFLRLPGDNGYSSTSVDLVINNNVSVSSPTLDGSNGSSVVYINSASSLYNLNLSKTSNQTIQITKPYGNTQQSEIAGYGKWVDNKHDLVKVECYVDGNLKQHVAFHGFNTTNSNAGTATRHNSNSNSYNFFDSHSQQDIWSTQARRGFRIRGAFSLNSVSYSNVLTHIGAAQSTPHTIQYKYIRHSDVGGSNNIPSAKNVYIDTLSSDPTSTNSTTTTTVKDVIYTMGIPSVKTVNIDFVRTYNNINSAHLYIRGDRKIARVCHITKINKPTGKYIYLARTNSSISGINNKAIHKTGLYTYSSSDFKTATNSYYHNAYYDESVGVQKENGTTLTSSEKLYSLRGSFNLSETFTVDHHFDKDSYNNVGSNAISTKFTYTDVYEISDNNIGKLNSDMGDIIVTQYTENETIPKDWTLLYYKGAFRTNASITYPNVNNYEWNSVVTTDSQYSAGTESYDLSGASTTDDSGYKWIVFKLSMNDKTNTNINGIITYYYDVYTYLITKGFSTQTVSKIRDSTNDVVAFVKQTVNNGVRIGNLGRAVNNMNLWYDQLSNVSYNDMVNSSSKNSYGCRYPSSSTTSWGPLLDTDNGDNVIYLFLGLKNKVSIS